MFKFLIIPLFFLAVTSHAQTYDSLIGNWKYKDVYNAEKLDSTKRAHLKIMFSDMTIHLKADKHYTAFLMKKEEGTWAYDAELKQLIFNHDKGEDRIRLIEVTGKTLVIEISKGQAFVLEKETH